MKTTKNKREWYWKTWLNNSGHASRSRRRSRRVALAGLAIASATLMADPPTAQEVDLINYLAPSVSRGAQITLRGVYSSGGLPCSLQWRFNGQDIVGATSITLIRTNMGLSDAGEYTMLARNADGEAVTPAVNLEVDPSFTQVWLPKPTANAFGGGWADLNGDGWLDLILGRGDSSKVLLNGRDGTFAVSQQIAAYADWTVLPVPADFDNDGDTDMAFAQVYHDVLQLWRNDGLGHLTMIRNLAFTRPLGLAWQDIDGDGYLDLYVGADGGDLPNGLFLNRRDGTFARVTQGGPGWDLVTKQGSFNYYIPAWADYDNDGLADVYIPVASYDFRSPIFHNEGQGHFALGPQFPTAVGSFSAAWADYDNDGDFDLYVGGFFLPGALGYLYQNQGDGTFREMSEPEVGPLVALPGDSAGVAWGDYDNDGDLDLYEANMGFFGSQREVNYLYLNQGDGAFVRSLAGSPANRIEGTWFVQWVDYDNDGFLDLFAASKSSESELYRNNLPQLGNNNRWLKARCEGRVTNRDGVGAKIRVKAIIGGQERWLLRQIASALAGGPSIAHFGLGDATSVMVLRVEWPSGAVQEYKDVGINQSLVIKEPPRLVATGPCEFQVACWTGMHFAVQASVDLKTWSAAGSVTNVNGSATFADPAGPQGTCRFYRVVDE